jgi:hypothetical protein
MDPITLAALAGVGGNIIGGGLSTLMSEGAYDDMKAAIEQQKILDPEAYVANYENYVLQGLIAPEQEADISAGESALADLRVDPQAREYLTRALAESTRNMVGGPTLLEKIQAAQSREQNIGAIRGQNEAVMQNRAARGLAGGGDELAMQMANTQAAAQRQSQDDANLMALAAQRRLQAIRESADISGKMAQQDLEVKNIAGSAKDRFKQFDVANRIGTQQRNVGSRNTAQMANLEAKQRIADMNIGLKNRQAEQLVEGRLGQAGALNKQAMDLGGLSAKEQLDRAQNVGKMFGAAGDTAMAGGKTISDTNFRNDAAKKGIYFRS